MVSFAFSSNVSHKDADKNVFSNMDQKNLFSAIAERNKELVREILEQGVNVNALSLWGTALYYSIKCHTFAISELLIEHGADCNIIQLDFDRSEQHPRDGLTHRCFISTPIDFLCTCHERKYDQILAYLLENRPMMSENVINERILYCKQLFDEKKNEMLLDYTASYLLRRNMYEHLLLVGDNSALTMAAAVFNIDAQFKRQRFQDGGTHEAFYTLIIRTFFEQMLRFRLSNGSLIVSEKEYSFFLNELLHNLEAYNLLRDICSIPIDKIESFYPSIAKNIVKKLKQMKVQEEYTLPIKWETKENWEKRERHAVCLNFIREVSSIVIRIDNLNSADEPKHTSYLTKDNIIIRMIPKIIGEIPIEKLDENIDYFISLLRCIKTTPDRRNGIKILYENDKIKHLDQSRASMMTDQLLALSKKHDCFSEQAQSNCFVKSHEPGLLIRSHDYSIFQKVIECQRVYISKLSVKDILQEREKLEQTFHDYWIRETTINYCEGKGLVEQFKEIYLADLRYRFKVPFLRNWEVHCRLYLNKENRPKHL